MPRPRKTYSAAVVKNPRDPIEFEERLPIRPSSPAWRASIRAFYGKIPLTEEELVEFHKVSGGIAPPKGGRSEFLAVAGRRAGKSEEISRLAVYEALYGNHAIALAPGQIGLIAIISPLREQSIELSRYCKGLCMLDEVRPYLDSEPTQNEIRFSTGVAIKIMTADAVAVSGPTIVCAIRDEWAKFPSEKDGAAMPDTEIENSLRPALAPVRGAPTRRLIGITSAYIRDGLAYDTDQKWYGKKDSPVLVVRGSTEDFNPNIDLEWLETQRRTVGERAFAREYLSVWQDATVDGYFSDVIDRAIDQGREFNHPQPGVDYFLAMDPAWKGDRWTLAVCHREREHETGPLRTVVDRVWVWVPTRGQAISTEETLSLVASIARQHGTETIFTDQAAAPVMIEMARRYGLHLKEIPWLAGLGVNSKSTKFRRVHGAMADGLIRLPDDPDLIREFSNISSTLLRSGAESIAARTGHDDRVSAVVLAVTEAMNRSPEYLLDDGSFRSTYERNADLARRHMDDLEVAEVRRFAEAREEKLWLGFGSGSIDWERLRRGRY